MSRYFIEVAYKGTNYAGFQKQDNANTIQAEVESALKTYFRTSIRLTGSSRTDAGVHARQNYFHFDTDSFAENIDFSKSTYHINAILPVDIAVKGLLRVDDNAHCRFDAISRTYEYRIYQLKNPFLQDSAFYYPFPLKLAELHEMAEELSNHTNFKTFSKKNSQVFTYNCDITNATWFYQEDEMIFSVTANRFLRGMVKGLVATMLHTVSRKLSQDAFRNIILSKDSAQAKFAVPPHALTLVNVAFNDDTRAI